MTAWPFADPDRYCTTADEMAPDQQERARVSTFSKGFAVPIEKPDNTPCGTTVLFRLEDGRLLARRVDCKTKACPKCGPRLRQQWAELWAAVMGGEALHRWVGSDREWAKLQRRKVMRSAEYGVIPGSAGTRVVYTSAEVGQVVTDVTEALAGDFAAMPNDARHKSLSAGWRRRADCIEAFTTATSDASPRAVEFLGFLRAGLEHARQLAREFGVYDQETGHDGSAFTFHQPDDPLSWRRFCRWAGLEHPGRRRPGKRRGEATAA